MATKDTQSAPKKGLLGWLRSQKQAEETASVPPVKLTRLTTPPAHGPPGDAQDAPGGKQFPEGAPGGREFQRDVAMRHVDKGEIARGGMGSIRKVYDTNLLRSVAMKVLFDEHRANAKNTQRFVEEAQRMGQLEHPNIVPVHELGEDEDGTRYFTMLYVRGKT